MAGKIDGVKLQMAMAFGQGAGAMLAEEEALEKLLSAETEMVERAAAKWSTFHWAFLTLLRTLGQISAVRAAHAGRARIRWVDIELSLSAVLGPCPSLELFDPERAAKYRS
jgi:hypothetical protein